jgi:hypothetical protein
VRDNILFGKEFKADKYEKVIQACALQQVIAIKYKWPLFNHATTSILEEAGLVHVSGARPTTIVDLASTTSMGVTLAHYLAL